MTDKIVIGFVVFGCLVLLIVGISIVISETLELCSPKPAATHYLICSDPMKTIPIYYDGGYVCDVDGGAIKVFAGAKCIIVPNRVELTGVGR